MSKKNKTRCSNTMTESEYWSWIRSNLRRMTMKWKPISEIKKKKRLPSTLPNKRLKWMWKCEMCNKYIGSQDLHIDHKIPAGSLRSSKDLEGFVNRLFCEEDGFQCLCKSCNYSKRNE